MDPLHSALALAWANPHQVGDFIILFCAETNPTKFLAASAVDQAIVGALSSWSQIVHEVAVVEVESSSELEEDYHVYNMLAD